MRREQEWLQRGPKARTTKAQSRIDSAEKLREDLRKVVRQQCPASNRGYRF